MKTYYINPISKNLIIVDGNLVVECAPIASDNSEAQEDNHSDKSGGGVLKKKIGRPSKNSFNRAPGKLTKEDKEAIVRRMAKGEKPSALAEEYGVNYGTILYHAKRGAKNGEPSDEDMEKKALELSGRAILRFKCSRGHNFSKRAADVEDPENIECPMEDCGASAFEI